MKINMQLKSPSLRFVVLPLLVVTAGLCGQSASAGGNGSGQPSGSTLAGTSAVPTATMSGQTSVIMTGGSTTTTETTPTGGGGTVTTTTVTLSATSVLNTLNSAGLNHDPNSTVQYVGPSGTVYTVSPDTPAGPSAQTTSPGSASTSSTDVVTTPAQLQRSGSFFPTQTSGLRIKVKSQIFATR